MKRRMSESGDFQCWGIITNWLSNGGPSRLLWASKAVSVARAIWSTRLPVDILEWIRWLWYSSIWQTARFYQAYSKSSDLAHSTAAWSFDSSLGTRREESICAVYEPLINITIKFLAQAQTRCFAREDEICHENSDGVPKQYGLRILFPPFVVETDTGCPAPSIVLFLLSGIMWNNALIAYDEDNKSFVTLQKSQMFDAKRNVLDSWSWKCH
jgi:hypothetical protein